MLTTCRYFTSGCARTRPSQTMLDLVRVPADLLRVGRAVPQCWMYSRREVRAASIVIRGAVAEDFVGHGHGTRRGVWRQRLRDLREARPS